MRICTEAQDLQTIHLVLLSQASVGWSEPENTYGTCQKEYNKRAAVALISAAYRVPCLSLRVRRTLSLFLKVCRLVKCRNPRIAVLFPWNRGTFGKKCRNTIFCACHTNPEANHKSATRCLIRLRHANRCSIILWVAAHETEIEDPHSTEYTVRMWNWKLKLQD